MSIDAAHLTQIHNAMDKLQAEINDVVADNTRLHKRADTCMVLAILSFAVAVIVTAPLFINFIMTGG